MKKLLLTIAILSGMISYATTQERIRRTFFVNEIGGKEVIKIFYEPQTGGNIILEMCDSKHYKCDRIKDLIRDFNKISTQEEDMLSKLSLFHNVLNMSITLNPVKN